MRDGKLQRLDGTLLADQPRRILELAAQVERQLGRVAGSVEQGSRKRATGLGGRWAGPARAQLAIGDRMFGGGQMRVL